MDPVSTLGYLLQHTASIMNRQADQVLQERLGIGMSQFKLLMMLQNNPDVRQLKLAECLGQTEASISRQVKLLQEKGMLAMQVNPSNRREHIIICTAKGVKITEAAREVLTEYVQPLVAHLSDKEQEKLIAMLSSVHQQVCAGGKPFACDRPFNI